MNLVLETFERVLYPGGGAAARRASTSGVPQHHQQPQYHHHPHHHHHHSSRPQAAAIARRRSGGINAIPSQPSGSGSPMMAMSASSNVFDAGPGTAVVMRGSSSERETAAHRSGSPGTMGGGGGEPIGGASGGSGASSRSRSGARRKKSSSAQPRKPSVASLLLAAISASAPTNRRRSRHPPPRQWSVPERGPGENAGAEGEEVPFQLVRKAPSVALPSSPCCSSRGSQPRTPPRKQLSGEEMPPPSSILAEAGEMASAGPGPAQSVLFGFVAGPSPPSAATARAASFRTFDRAASTEHHHPAHHPSTSAESSCLAQCGHIRQWPSLTRALLLRCVDPEPTYPYLHYAVFDGSDQGEEVAEAMNTWTDSSPVAHPTDFASFEEVIALERQTGGGGGLSARHPPPSAPSHHPPPPSSAHHGFIVLCFRLLADQQQDEASSAQLESSWLSWTGAHEIYKYSPRAWHLRRLSLHRRAPSLSTASVVADPPVSCSPLSFSYVLLCEFGAILHPANALGALDMCERLRARNCGFVALYQVRHCYGSPSSATASPLLFHSPVPNSLSPHWSPHQLRRRAAGLAGGAHMLARLGHSQDVPDSSGGALGQRRTVLLRMRERSLGWDMLTGGGGGDSDSGRIGDNGTPL